VRLLYLAPRFPDPAGKGDQLVVFHRLRVLSRRHEITLVSLYEQGQLGELEEVRGYCESVELVPLQPWLAVARTALRSPLSRDPLQILYYASGLFRRRVLDVARSRSFDVVHGFMLRTHPYLPLVEAPAVLDAMDSMQLRMQRNVEVERGPKKLMFAEELRRLRRFERAIGDDVAALIVVSEQDRPFFEKANVVVVPNGVDTDEFAPGGSREPRTIVFSGIMSYLPNVRAACWFVDECLPQIRAAVPDAAFVIAGRSPTAEVRRLANRDGVTVTGSVESMAEVLGRAAVAVAPMLSGAGIQTKILEAMACGLPVVTTPIGLGGIGVSAAEEILVADSARAFADAVASLLRDPVRAAVIGGRARARVLAGYTWERAAAAVEQTYEEVVRQSRRAEAAAPHSRAR
jgi:sugar transferase (PEP-CTERM/EpsH1 system associated)